MPSPIKLSLQAIILSRKLKLYSRLNSGNLGRFPAHFNNERRLYHSPRFRHPRRPLQEARSQSQKPPSANAPPLRPASLTATHPSSPPKTTRANTSSG